MMNSETENKYWTLRYEEQRTGWDIGYPSTPLKTYIDQLEDKSIKILIPGAGNAYEAEYLFSKGFKNVDILDISKLPLDEFKVRLPEFPQNQLRLANFFEFSGEYDLILEQTFFCSFEPSDENRNNYAKKMTELLTKKGKLVGLWFDMPLIKNTDKRPFGGTKADYLKYLNPFFDVKYFERCYNSISERQGKELFGVFIKK